MYIDIVNTFIYFINMDDHFELKGISFVWDRAKSQANVSKHGISFEQAAEVFFDPFLRIRDAGPEDEARDAVIGMDEDWQLLFVVNISFQNDRIRIISARRATRSERLWYED
jgi:uncharacterized DUF497 family protein